MDKTTLSFASLMEGTVAQEMIRLVTSVTIFLVDATKLDIIRV